MWCPVSIPRSRSPRSEFLPVRIPLIIYTSLPLGHNPLYEVVVCVRLNSVSRQNNFNHRKHSVAIYWSFYCKMQAKYSVQIHRFSNVELNAIKMDSVLLTFKSLNPLKGSGIRWLHFKVFSAIQVEPTFLISDILALWRSDSGAQDWAPECPNVRN